MSADAWGVADEEAGETYTNVRLEIRQRDSKWLGVFSRCCSLQAMLLLSGYGDDDHHYGEWREDVDGELGCAADINTPLYHCLALHTLPLLNFEESKITNPIST